MKKLFVISFVATQLFSFTLPTSHSSTAKIFGVQFSAHWLQRGEVSDDGKSKTCIFCKKNRILCMCIDKADINVDFEFGIAGPKENDGKFGGVLRSEKSDLVMDIVITTLHREELSWLKNGETRVENKIYIGMDVLKMLKKQGYKGSGFIYPGVYKVKKSELAGNSTYRISFPNKEDVKQVRGIGFPIKVRVGSRVSDKCSGNNPCGPCGGFCIKWEPKKQKSRRLLTVAERKNGTRIVNVEMLNDKEMKIAFQDNDYDLGNSTHEIEDDFDLGKNISKHLNLRKVILLKGIYKIDYSESKFGTSIVKVKTEK